MEQVTCRKALEGRLEAKSEQRERPGWECSHVGVEGTGFITSGKGGR